MTDTLYNNFTTFIFAYFGIAISIFTLLYSILSNLHLRLRDLNNEIMSGSNSPRNIQKRVFIRSRIRKTKKIMNVLIFIIIISFVFLLFNAFYTSPILKNIMSIVFIILTALTGYILIKTFRSYKHYYPN